MSDISKLKTEIQALREEIRKLREQQARQPLAVPGHCHHKGCCGCGCSCHGWHYYINQPYITSTYPVTWSVTNTSASSGYSGSITS